MYLERRNTVTKMILNDMVLEKMDKNRLFDLMFYHQLPISQAIAYHLCIDLNWKNSDAAKLVGLSNIAIADAKRKSLDKLGKND